MEIDGTEARDADRGDGCRVIAEERDRLTERRAGLGGRNPDTGPDVAGPGADGADDLGAARLDAADDLGAPQAGSTSTRVSL